MTHTPTFNEQALEGCTTGLGTVLISRQEIFPQGLFHIRPEPNEAAMRDELPRVIRVSTVIERSGWS